VLSAQEIPASQPPLWHNKLDVVAFEKLENQRLDAAQQPIAEIVAVHGMHTVENTLAPYDNAIQLPHLIPQPTFPVKTYPFRF
jgi:hypothetical protein